MLRRIDNTGNQFRPTFAGNLWKMSFDQIRRLHQDTVIRHDIVYQKQPQHGKTHHQGPAKHH